MTEIIAIIIGSLIVICVGLPLIAIIFLVAWAPIILPIYFIYRYKKQKRAEAIAAYESSTYFQNTNRPYDCTMNDSGFLGEYLIYEKLKFRESVGAKFLFNAYLPTVNNKTTEVDVIMIDQYGIFVFESKNYSGWIFGNENSKQWCQCLKASRYDSQKEYFYNPIMQNKTHIKAIRHQIKQDWIPMYSIIAFSDRCDFMEIPNGHNIIHRNNVNKTVSNIFNKNQPCLNDKQVEWIYNKLYPYTQVTEDIKQKHIQTTCM